MNDNDPSILRNRHEDLVPVVAQPLVGEVKAGASDPSQEDTVSVLANKPEASPLSAPIAPLGEVPAGASNDVDVPPSIRGTSYDPSRNVVTP